ncbi:MAG: glycosyltransferase family 1 protein, partial [Miltoncostaeaceae bacterium]
LAQGAAGLAAAIGRLIDDPAERERLSAAGQARAAERYSWDACAKAYLSLCRAARERAGYAGAPS